MTTEDRIAQLASLMDRARQARLKAEEALAELKTAAKDFKPVLEKWTREARTKEPELFQEWQRAYLLGESIKNTMQIEGRWPKLNTNETTYAGQLRSLKPSERSPELQQCLDAWEAWERCHEKWKSIFPLPSLFFWSGPTADGPNLWTEFGVSL